MNKIRESIEKLLEKHRIVVWYDAEEAFTEEFENLELSDGEKILVNGDELSVKTQILLDEPEKKFLLYLPKEKPANEANWLLDIEIGYHVYHTDQEALYLQEIGLGYHFKDWIRDHLEFFKNKDRLAAFRDLVEDSDYDRLLSLKLMQVVFGTKSTSLDYFLQSYAKQYVIQHNEFLERQLERFNLWEMFWQEVGHRYHYHAENPSIYDFLIEVFQKNFSPTSSSASVNRETGVMVSVWKDTLSFQEHFKKLSQQIQQDLNIEEILNDVEIDDILDDDLFELIDRRIISGLVQRISEDSIDSPRLDSIIKKRETTHWIELYRPFYQALDRGLRLLETINKEDEISFPDLERGIEAYTKRWYVIDQYYREFIRLYQETNQNNVLSPLYNKVNKAYSNTWLLRINNSWQSALEKDGSWYNGVRAQKNFFRNHVKPYIRKKNRLFVIISDALRYECGVSFHQKMLKENRFESTLDYMVTSLPSYTQLGMASLLPHQKISFGKSDDIFIDDMPTGGLQQRKKILEQGAGTKATAIQAEELMNMATKGDEARSLVNNHELIYIYHNRIDKLGDDKNSEGKVIEAAQKELAHLVDMVKKITNMNGNNIIITSDHGFVYQNEVLDESDFADAQVDGEIIKMNRRFILGRNLNHQSNVQTYNTADLGIDGNIQVLIPKGINRLRVQGAGLRYIHGGATPQETIVPVITVTKKRENTVSKVDVDILNKSSNKITTNIQRVNFYQSEPVGDRVVGRTLKAQFKSENGEALSDVFNYTFNSDSKDAKNREVEYRFQLSSVASKEYKNQTVYLYLEEKVEGSNKWVIYQKFPYTINISFAKDFDDF